MNHGEAMLCFPAVNSEQNTGGISHYEWSNGSCYYLSPKMKYVPEIQILIERL